MSNNKIFSYDAMKTVFGFLPMNKREELVRECNGVRRIDQILPYQTLNEVSFGEFKLEIDDRRYCIGMETTFIKDGTEDFEHTLDEIEYDEETHYSDSRGITIWSRTPRRNGIRPVHIEEENVARGDRNAYGFGTRRCPMQIRRVFRMDMTSSQGVFTHRFENSNRFPFLMELLMKSYFDKRGVTRIKHLRFGPDSDNVIRLPDGVKLRVHKLSFQNRGGARLFCELERVIDRESLPLEQVSFTLHDSNDAVFNSYLLQSAKCLKIRSCLPIIEEVLGLKNRIIEVNAKIDKEDLIVLVQNWISEGRELGTTFRAGVGRYETVLDVQDELIESRGAVRGTLTNSEYADTFFKNCVTIPMTDDSELNLFGCELDAEYMKKSKARWFFKMEVMKSGSAVPKMNA